MLIVLRIKKAPKSLMGRLQRLFLEISPGMFVGRLPSLYFQAVWGKIARTNCSAICVISTSCESGFDVRCHGEDQRFPVENMGIKLIQYQGRKPLVAG